jgi:hypothetical protein
MLCIEDRGGVSPLLLLLLLLLPLVFFFVFNAFNSFSEALITSYVPSSFKTNAAVLFNIPVLPFDIDTHARW